MIGKKAEMGVGTLIIFIAMLLVAAVAAGVLIQTVGSLQEKSLSTGSQAEGQIATNALTVEISATDGSDGEIDDFSQIMKLAPGSEPMKLDSVILSFNTYTSTATLQYRGTNGTYVRDRSAGYNTVDEEELGQVGNTVNNVTLEEDFDGDNQTDYFRVLNRSHFQINTSQGRLVNISSDGYDLNDTSVTVSISSKSISDGGVTLGSLTVAGSPDVDGTAQLPATATVTITPASVGTGYFTVEYLQQGNNFVNGNLQRGDVIKVYYESPGSVGSDEELRLNFIPKIGTATLAQFVTPEVISTERVYLYP